MPGGEETNAATVDVRCREPFDLGLSLRAMRSFDRPAAEAAAAASAAEAGAGASPAGAAARPAVLGAIVEPGRAVLRLGVRLDDVPTLLEAWQVSVDPPVVRAQAQPRPRSAQALQALTARIVNADLDLRPFYERAAANAVLGPLTRDLVGLKPFRPASLFDMLVTAVIEQQISLAAARKIRARVVGRFGEEAEGEPVFPTPESLAGASLEALAECGLSRRKAEYASGIAGQVVAGTLDLDELERASDDEVRARIVSIRGFGPWSAEYALIRGLARVDAVPIDDLGVRVVIGKLLGDGTRPTPACAAELLEPLAPYRGLAAFYLLVAERLVDRSGSVPAAAAAVRGRAEVRGVWAGDACGKKSTTGGDV